MCERMGQGKAIQRLVWVSFLGGLLLGGAQALAEQPEVIPSEAVQSDVEAAAQPTSTELSKLRDYVSQIDQRALELQQSLQDSELRLKQQSAQIDNLEQQLASSHARERLRETAQQVFFSELAKRVAESDVFRVELEQRRVRIEVPGVYVFSTSELGQEGRARLQPLAEALLSVAQDLPPELNWRLRVEGHTDARALRPSARFPTNWELSAERAVQLLRFLVDSGLPRQNVYAAALADTKPLQAGDSRAANQANRRTELHLEITP